MIRKQVYLQAEMNEKLNEIAQARGVPQAEIIREGLETYLASQGKKAEVWDELLARMARFDVAVKPWSREELYADRIQAEKEGSGEGEQNGIDR